MRIQRIQTRLLPIAVTAMLLMGINTATAQVWMNPGVNDGSFDASWGGVLPGSGNTIGHSEFNDDDRDSTNEAAVGSLAPGNGIWSYTANLISSDEEIEVGSSPPFGFAEFRGSLGPNSTGLVLASEGTQNPDWVVAPDEGRAVASFVDRADTRVTASTTLLTVPAGVSAGDMLEYSFDLQGLPAGFELPGGTPNGNIDLGIDFGNGLVNFVSAFQTNSPDGDTDQFDTFTGSYQLQAADLTAGTFSVEFTIRNLEISGNGAPGRLFLDNLVFEIPRQPGDVDYDGDVDQADYALIRDNFRATGAVVGDINGPNGSADGVVDFFDFVEWQENFPFAPGAGSLAAGSQTVPEPGSAIVCLAAAVMGGLYRWRQS